MSPQRLQHSPKLAAARPAGRMASHTRLPLPLRLPPVRRRQVHPHWPRLRHQAQHLRQGRLGGGVKQAWRGKDTALAAVPQLGFLNTCKCPMPTPHARFHLLTANIVHTPSRCTAATRGATCTTPPSCCCWSSCCCWWRQRCVLVGPGWHVGVSCKQQREQSGQSGHVQW